ncbi:MAG: hypothetical protein IKH44_00060 [Bacteroidales bacterium]|nr:hypothetical protein [Bacteroidales bacterium]
MKKNYMKPTLYVVIMQTNRIICGSGTVSGVGGNASLNYGGGSSSAAMSREGDWDEDED